MQREMEEEERLQMNMQMRDMNRQAIAQQNHHKQMNQLREAEQLKMETKKNEQLIAMQREQEVMKNNSIKEMIRQQKLLAEEKKEAVSISPPFLQFI